MMDDKLKIIYEYHMMIVVWLMIYLLRNQLGNYAGLLITLPVRISFWKVKHHEPLVLTFFVVVKLKD